MSRTVVSRTVPSQTVPSRTVENAPVRVGLVGCGKISEAYLGAPYPGVEYVACADLDRARALATAEAHGLRAESVDDLLADAEIDVVCNLTVPQAHATVGLRALEAGKHVYCEKPLATRRADAWELLAIAAASGLLVGCAPDTFLGAGLQTCRKVIDDGLIGAPIAAMAHMVNHGHEHWHPDPAFYYETGGGPLLDMGPYYLTALVALLGPIARVVASTSGIGSERIVPVGPRAGEVLAVEVPTHVAGVVDLVDGTIASIVTSFDVFSSELPRLEIHGSEGSLLLPDPNTFSGPVRLFRRGARAVEEIAVERFALEQRGIGLADLAAAAHGTATGANRASGDLAYHVLDAMIALAESGETGERIDLASTVRRPPPMPPRDVRDA